MENVLSATEEDFRIGSLEDNESWATFRVAIRYVARMNFENIVAFIFDIDLS